MGSWDLKDENDVKLYLENLEIEYKFGCYKEKKPEVCHLLADFYEAVKFDYEKSGKVYGENCDLYNHGHSCYKYGNYNYLGRGGVEVSHQKAMDYYEKGCKMKYPVSCAQAGMMMISKNADIPKDQKKAMSYFEAGCELNENTACHYYGAMFIAGIENVVEKNLTKAFEYTNKACELGNPYACANLSQMYKRGDGVEKNPEMAAHFRKIAKDYQDQFNTEFRGIEFGKGGA